MDEYTMFEANIKASHTVTPSQNLYFMKSLSKANNLIKILKVKRLTNYMYVFSVKKGRLWVAEDNFLFKDKSWSCVYIYLHHSGWIGHETSVSVSWSYVSAVSAQSCRSFQPPVIELKRTTTLDMTRCISSAVTDFEHGACGSKGDNSGVSVFKLVPIPCFTYRYMKERGPI